MAKTLSVGSLDQILEQKVDNITPVVQILGTKVMNSNRIRAVVWDGVTMSQHCILISEEIDQMNNDGLLSKFTVIRIEQFSLSPLPKKENIFVLLVNRMSILKKGEEIEHKLNADESYEVKDETVGGFDEPSLSTASSALSSSTFNRQSPPASKPAAKPKPVVFDGPNTLKSENVCPINVLSPFFSAWVLRVRVTNKTPLKTYSNKKGDGKLFSFDVCDENGEIRFTAFNAECDKFFDLIEPGRVYLISRGSIKNANKKFSSLNNEYEITLNSNSVIEPCVDVESSGSIPQIRYKFTPLAEMANLPQSTMIDVIGVIRSIGPIESLTSKKTGKELTKKEIAMVDKSNYEVRITVWNEVAENFEGEVDQILALKGAIIGEFKGKNLSTVQSTMMRIEPDLPETLLLRQWYDTTGKSASYTSLSTGGDGPSVGKDTRFICEINNELLAANPGGNIYSNINGTIQSTNRSNNHMYKACSNSGCFKKVTDDNSGLYQCSKCDSSSPNFEWRLMLSLQVADATGSMWLTIFHEQGESLLGLKTPELAQLFESDPDQYSKVINAIRFKGSYFRIGSRADEYNNEIRVKSSAYKMAPHTSVDRAKRLMSFIDTISKQVSA